MLILHLCGICSYINNTEYRIFPDNKSLFNRSIEVIAHELGPGWMGHRMCCINDIYDNSFNITTYSGENKTLNTFIRSNRLVKRYSTRFSFEVADCLISASMFVTALHIIYTMFQTHSFENKCSKYDFADSKTLTTLYSTKSTINDILKFDEKLCSANLKYCTRIEHDKLVTRRTDEIEFCLKNANRAVKLGDDGSIELFNTQGNRNVIWIRRPYVIGAKPFRMVVSNTGAIKVIGSNNKVVYETTDLHNPKTRYHEIY